MPVWFQFQPTNTKLFLSREQKEMVNNSTPTEAYQS